MTDNERILLEDELENLELLKEAGATREEDEKRIEEIKKLLWE